MRFFRPVPRVSLAKLGDAPELAALYSRAWAGLRGQVHDDLVADNVVSEADIAAWFRGGFEIYRASHEGQLVGAVRCCFPVSTCLVDRLAVEPSFRGKGFGHFLAEHAVSRAKRAGVTRVWHPGSPKLESAVSIFRDLGFLILARQPARYWGEDVVLMELSL